MTSISLLALLVVLGGLRLQLTNAAPGFADRRQKMDLRDEDGSDSGREITLSAEEKKQLILEKLQQDGSVIFTSNGMVVQVTKDKANGSDVSQDAKNLLLDARDVGGTSYSVHFFGILKPMTFEQFRYLLNKLAD